MPAMGCKDPRFKAQLGLHSKINFTLDNLMKLCLKIIASTLNHRSSPGGEMVFCLFNFKVHFKLSHSDLDFFSKNDICVHVNKENN